MVYGCQNTHLEVKLNVHILPKATGVVVSQSLGISESLREERQVMRKQNLIRTRIQVLHKIKLYQLRTQITGTQERSTSAKHLAAQSCAQLPLAFPFLDGLHARPNLIGRIITVSYNYE